jgi:hypothetical protein
MNRPNLTVVLLLAGIAWPAAGVHAQAPAGAPAGRTGVPWTPSRTADGKPDLQGTWTNATYTPVERPAEFKDREFFTAQEAADFARRALTRFLSQSNDDAHYDNSIWMSEKKVKGLSSLRTSIVVDPADGRLPPLTEEGRRRAEQRAAERKRSGLFDSAQTRGLAERCIYWAHEGPPLMPTGYNSNLRIVQAPGSFVIIPEMNPAARVVPLDGRPHVGTGVRTLHGDSRGRWDGDTLVVETTNFTDVTAFRGASQHMKVTERFTLVAADTIRYQFTVEDPHTWATPWSGEYPMTRTPEDIYEYACHEGNYGMPNILRAQRRIEERQRTQTPATATQP